MGFRTAFLTTRVARRMFALFLLSAMAPVVVFAAVSYRQVTDELHATTTTRLRQESKAFGNSLLERLAQIDAALHGGLRAIARETVAVTWSQDGEGLDQRSLGLAIGLQPDSIVLRDGSVVRLPPLNDGERARLEFGAPLLLMSGTQPLLVRQVDESTRAWLAIDPGYLLTGQDRQERFSPVDGLCIVLSDGTPVACPMADRFAAGLTRGAIKEGGSIRWEVDGEGFVAANTPLFLKYRYGSQDWIVAHVASDSSIVAPLAHFRSTLLRVALLTVLVVGLVSQVRLRRGLQPIEALKAGTERVAHQEFNEPVRVASGDEFESLADSFNSMASYLHSQFTTLTAINEMDRVTLGNNDRWKVLSAIVQHSRTVVRCEGLEIGLPVSNDLCDWEWVRALEDAVTIDGTTLSTEEVVYVRALVPESDVLLPAGVVGRRGERWSASLALPVHHEGRLVALVVLRRAEDAFAPEEVAKARRLRDHIGVTLSNLRLFGELNAMTEGALLGLARAIDAKSPWTSGHSERVTQVSLEIGSNLGLDTETLDLLRRGGLLHDIGKIGIPLHILDKPGALTLEEKQIMDSHTVIGESILSPIGPFEDMLPIVRSHHERWDGTGYPDRLAGEDIPYLARVLAVADVYDAMRSERPYRSGWGRSDTLVMIREGSGTHFDPRVMDAFLTWANAERGDMYAGKDRYFSRESTVPTYGVAG